MGLISLQFGIFILTALILYYIVPLKMRWFILLSASVLFFLLSTQPYLAVYPIFSILSVYCAAIYVGKETAQYKKAIFFVTVAFNIAILSALKYVEGLWSIGGEFVRIFGYEIPRLELGWLAPLGISFYTLQLIGYLTDVYRGINPAQNNLLKLSLFATWFPSISSGPILRYNQAEQELFTGNKLSYQNITFGAQRMLWGLFKKLVVAERMAILTGTIFGDADKYTGVWLWVGIFACVIQVYTDFSGNMDLIIGVSECFGVKLPDNFRQPFFSKTIQEFWQRWHITLGLWLRDYIMYPILRSELFIRFGKVLKTKSGKKTAKLLPTVIAMLLLWLANGVWHGGYLNFFLFAIWFWLALTIGQLIEPVGRRIVERMEINTDNVIWKLFQRTRTFLIFSIGSVFFFIPSVRDTLRIFKHALDIRNLSEVFKPAEHFLSEDVAHFGGISGGFILLISMVLMFFVESKQNKGVVIRQWLAGRNIALRWILLLTLIFATLIFGVYGQGYNASDFMYAGF